MVDKLRFVHFQASVVLAYVYVHNIFTISSKNVYVYQIKRVNCLF